MAVPARTTDCLETKNAKAASAALLLLQLIVCEKADLQVRHDTSGNNTLAKA